MTAPTDPTPWPNGSTPSTSRASGQPVVLWTKLEDENVAAAIPAGRSTRAIMAGTST